MEITEEQKNELNQFLSRHSFNTISRNELTAEFANQSPFNGWTLLYLATQSGNAKVARILIKAGADINQTNNVGNSLLWTAASSGHSEVAKLLIDEGAIVDKSRQGTPLLAAAQNGHTKVAQLLLERGAKIDGTMFGVKPLRAAVQNGHLDTFRLLFFAKKLSANPNPDFRIVQNSNTNPQISEIANCAPELFTNLRKNLNLISQADKLGLNPDEYSSMSSFGRLFYSFNFFRDTQQGNTTQIVLKALYDNFEKAENLENFLREFTEKTTPEQLSRFNLNDPESLSSLLQLSDQKNIPSGVSQQIAEFQGPFSEEKRTKSLKKHLNNEDVVGQHTASIVNRGNREQNHTEQDR